MHNKILSFAQKKSEKCKIKQLEKLIKTSQLSIQPENKKDDISKIL